jgi:hypothetical protein
VTVTITDNGTSDTLTVASATCPAFILGTVALGGDYVSANATFAGSGSNASKLQWDPSTNKLTITLGSGSGGISTGVTIGKPRYTPTSGLVDLAGNPLATTQFISATTSGF